MSWAFSSLNTSPGARAFYDAQRAKGLEHNDALRRLANRLVGILHGCLKTRDPLRRGHRLGPPGKPPSIFRRGLTSKLLGCLCTRTETDTLTVSSRTAPPQQERSWWFIRVLCGEAEFEACQVAGRAPV